MQRSRVSTPVRPVSIYEGSFTKHKMFESIIRYWHNFAGLYVYTNVFHIETIYLTIEIIILRFHGLMKNISLV